MVFKQMKSKKRFVNKPLCLAVGVGAKVGSGGQEEPRCAAQANQAVAVMRCTGDKVRRALVTPGCGGEGEACPSPSYPGLSNEKI